MKYHQREVEKKSTKFWIKMCGGLQTVVLRLPLDLQRRPKICGITNYSLMLVCRGFLLTKMIRKSMSGGDDAGKTPDSDAEKLNTLG